MNRELKKRLRNDSNQLSLNIGETNFVTFHSPHANILEPIVIRLCMKKVQCENYVKCLGVLLDANLNWKHHINELSKKLPRTLGIFYKIRHFGLVTSY